ncbi:hypothetical protein Tco_0097953 [Tanacetum coccineum]
MSSSSPSSSIHSYTLCNDQGTKDTNGKLFLNAKTFFNKGMRKRSILLFQEDENNVSFSGVVLGVEEESMQVYDTDIEDVIEEEE